MDKGQGSFNFSACQFCSLDSVQGSICTFCNHVQQVGSGDVLVDVVDDVMKCDANEMLEPTTCDVRDELTEPSPLRAELASPQNRAHPRDYHADCHQGGAHRADRGFGCCGTQELRSPVSFAVSCPRPGPASMFPRPLRSRT